MASSSCWKLRALIKKNLILKRRNLLSTIFEIFFPILMFGLIIALRKSFPITIKTFEEIDNNITYFMENKSIISSIDYDRGLEFMHSNELNRLFNLSSLVNWTDFDFSSYAFEQFDFDKLNFTNVFKNLMNISHIGNMSNLTLRYLGVPIMIPPLYICSKLNDQKQERPYIASIGIPKEIKYRMIVDSKIFNAFAHLYGNKEFDFNFELNNNSFKEFESVEAMEKYIKKPDYINQPENSICFGMKYSYNETINHYDYSLHFFDFDKIGKEGVQDIPNNGAGMFDRFQSGPDIISFMRYKNGAYNYMMKVVNEYILKNVTHNPLASFSYGVFPMKYTDFRLDFYGQFFGYIITIIIVIAYISPLSLYIYKIVEEKEAKTKEGMKIMGLGEGIYFLSYFIQYSVIAIFVSGINSFLLNLVFKNVPYYYLYIMILLFSLNIFSLIYFFQSFIDKTKIAIVLSLIIYFIMYCVSLSCMLENIPFLIKAILSIFPSVCLNLGILLFSKFDYHFRKFYDRDFFIYHTNYSIFFMYIMLIVDFFLYLFLGYYLHNVLPHDFGIRKPWYFLCSTNYWCKKNKKYRTKKDKLEFEEFNTRESRLLDDEREAHIRESRIKKMSKTELLYGRSSKFENEDIYDDKGEDEVFEIRNLVKRFGDGKVAVNGVNLNFYKDEIFALLGHNGAGKTTFISILTGMYEATKGKAIYDGDNVLDSHNMDIFRRKLGICPQHDTLFEDLTVREHLEIFSIFKGVKSSEVNREITKTLRDFQIENIEYMLARNLSAGQRRKLSIAISLIGGSEVIFLDEPSSGMDITSRRNLWEILKRQCDGKIIILTTHYMEEASVLGKRIGIINGGKMKCIGSPLFLIEKYGKYMSLNVSIEENADNNKIVEFVTSLAKNIEYEILSEEIMFRIPVKDDDNIEKKLRKNLDIPKFFQDLDDNISDLNIKSYSVSMPTLEDVFLNVAAEENKKTKEERDREKAIEEENDKILFSGDLKGIYTPREKFKIDFKICLKRRYLITKRDIKGFLMEVLCPIFLVLFGLLISKVEMIRPSSPVKINLGLTGNQEILFSSMNEAKSQLYFQNSSNASIIDLDIYKSDNRTLVTQKFIEEVYNRTYQYEDNRFRTIDMSNENYKGIYSSILLFSNENSRYEFIMALNSRVKHCIPIYSHYVLSSIIKKEAEKRNENVCITFTHYPMPLTVDLKEQNSIGNNLAIIFFIAIAFAIMPANFISLLVKERTNNSKHLMRISGINIISYWLVNYLFEFIKYYATAGICLICLYIFNFYKKYFYILYLVYGPAMISLTYAMSFFFNDESNAQNSIILLNFIFGDLGSIIILVLRLIESMKEPAKIIQHILSLTPTFCFDFSFNLLLNRIGIYTMDYPKDVWYNFKGDEMIKDWNLMLPLIVYCSAECVIYTLLFVLLESLSYSFKKAKNEILVSQIIDKEVESEAKRANTSISEVLIPYEISENEDDDFLSINERIIPKHKNVVVRVKNLRKIYRNGCKKGNVAINNLNFCIESGECFGLLGLNGAGKTTTFKCITQEIGPTNGNIVVFGKEINGNFNELNKIFGYCPQFDAIFEHLTVYENLEFYATIKGIKRNLIRQVVTFMIMEMSLTEFTNKISGRLSGGNKRKLSVAISMLGNPPIILLDEPSTGMDPEARRFMWSVIHKMSTKGRKSSVIMTTHSMDEAETLCKRMGIMVNGEFVCLGTANQIKEKYGYGYEADVRIKPMSHLQQKEVLDKYELDYDLKVTNENVNDILNTLEKPNYFDELRPGRLGERLKKAMNINEGINIGVLLNWLFFVENALKFIEIGKKYFSEIILSEHIENNFLFKLKKGNQARSIGFFFGLFDGIKEECHITEYSIQQTSLEQIFNKFASNQGNFNNEIDSKDLIKEKNYLIIDDDLLNKLII